ncbi:Leucine-rich repeat receptor-like protein kinase PEPR1 [Hondaea fermentalgiana]|uniref:Leucine-rich repeat receptor-like protein kinase PEPR1 n=1 Tax=Hondaea fermentalgiana TaxID=2315210 RepID=A0A2R5GY65_9STRA|nr:Leucine-rich repeat receptor-like protein kinase PEPR1 [Hondaea fermentalgiana]|eukprot:GBG33391.1 Leucine-rich repeat receptor-like protein kinase PEPR1 [Hondaea fermentalgiana]
MTRSVRAAIAVAALGWVAPRVVVAEEVLADCAVWPNISASVTVIDCHGEIDGELPEGLLENLPELTHVDLSEAGLLGTLPSQVSALSALTYLDMSGNKLSGSIPTSLGTLENLEYIDLNDNQLTGEIPVELENLVKLEILDLSENLFTGEIPEQLASLPNLSLLKLNDNYLTGCVDDAFLDVCQSYFGDFHYETAEDGVRCYFFSKVCGDRDAIPSCRSNETCTHAPTSFPTFAPTLQPTLAPSPTAQPSAPTFAPTMAPTYAPTTLNAGHALEPHLVLALVILGGLRALAS